MKSICITTLPCQPLANAAADKEAIVLLNDKNNKYKVNSIFVNECRKLLAEGSIDAVFNIEFDSKEFEQYRSRYKHVKLNFSKGLIEFPDYEKVVNQVISGLLDFFELLITKDEFEKLEKNKTSNQSFSSLNDESKNEITLNKIWNNMYLSRYYYEYYDLAFEQQKLPESELYENMEQLKVLHNLRSMCLEHTNFLENLYINYSGSKDENELLNKKQIEFDMNLNELDTKLKLSNIKKLLKKAEKITKQYFENIYSIV